MTVWFESTWTGFGGSTLILSSVVRLLNEVGIETWFYGKQEWFLDLSPYNRVKPSNFLPLQPDDVYVCHMKDLPHRAGVRKCLAMIHEPTFPFRYGYHKCSHCGGEGIAEVQHSPSNHPPRCPMCAKKAFVFQRASSFDHFIFSSVAHDEKSKRLQRYWGPNSIIPNPIETNFQWTPPSEPVAGVIGSLAERKQTHVSIRKAQEAGFKKVLLYGNLQDSGYFKEHVEPLLDENVQWLGEAPDRQTMYNSVSEVFHYALTEQACMVLGECKKLGIPIHRSAETLDWDLYSDEYIVKAWRELLEL